MKEFSCGLMVRIPGDHCHGPNSVPGWGTEILQAVQHSEKKKRMLRMSSELVLRFLKLTL